MAQKQQSPGINSPLIRDPSTLPPLSPDPVDPWHVCVCVCACVCVPDESMQQCFGEGTGMVYQDVLSWLQSSNTQLQLSGALAIANFARNG